MRAPKQRVSEQIIKQMDISFEVPSPANRNWEKHSITVDTSETVQDLEREIPWKQVVEMWQEPLPPIVEEETEEEQHIKRRVNMENLQHQIDLHTRKIVTEIVVAKTHQNGNTASPNVKTLANSLGQKRKTFLAELKGGKLDKEIATVCSDSLNFEEGETLRLIQHLVGIFKKDAATLA